jgi:hypothetical protein
LIETKTKTKTKMKTKKRPSQPGIATTFVKLLSLTVVVSLVPLIIFNLMHNLLTAVNVTATIVSNLAREDPITVNMVTSFFGTKKEMDVQGRLILIVCSSFTNEVRAASRKMMKSRTNGTRMTRMRTSHPGTAAKDWAAPSQ